MRDACSPHPSLPGPSENISVGIYTYTHTKYPSPQPSVPAPLHPLSWAPFIHRRRTHQIHNTAAKYHPSYNAPCFAICRDTHAPRQAQATIQTIPQCHHSPPSTSLSATIPLPNAARPHDTLPAPLFPAAQTLLIVTMYISGLLATMTQMPTGVLSRHAYPRTCPATWSTCAQQHCRIHS